MDIVMDVIYIVMDVYVMEGCDGGMCGIYCDACVIYIVRIYVNCLSVTIM